MGLSSSGTIAANGGAFDVSADHTYARKGSYGVAIQIHGFVDAETCRRRRFMPWCSAPRRSWPACKTILDHDLEWDGSHQFRRTTYDSGTYESGR